MREQIERVTCDRCGRLIAAGEKFCMVTGARDSDGDYPCADLCAPCASKLISQASFLVDGFTLKTQFDAWAYAWATKAD